MAADRDRDRWARRDRRERDDRGFWERAGDQVRSWFDEDDQEETRAAGPGGGRRGLGYGRERGYRDDVGYGTEAARRGWDMDEEDLDRGAYGDYGEMARSGYGWAGRGRSDWGAEWQGRGWRGDRFGAGPGGRYGPGSGARYGPGFAGRYGPAFERRYGPAAGRGPGPGLGDSYGPNEPYGAGGRPTGGMRSSGDEGLGGYGGMERDRYYSRWGASDWEEQAARREGPYSGVGPAGYKRSAERIAEDVNEELTWEPFVDASQIRVRVEGDEVVLEGSVDSRRAKRVAEAAADRVRGVRDVHNRLRVEAAQGGSASGASSRSEQAQGSQGQAGTDPSAAGQSTAGRSVAGEPTQGRSSSTQGQPTTGRTESGTGRPESGGSE